MTDDTLTDTTTADPLTPPRSQVVTPDDARRLLTEATTPEGRVALRDAARYLAHSLVFEAENHARTESILSTLARLVDAGDPEAPAMARDLVARRTHDPRVDSIHAEGGRLRTTMRGWAASTLAVGCMGLLDGPPLALRYVEVELAMPGADGRRVLVTVQRAERPSPNDCRLAAEARADVAEAEVARLRAELDALRAVGGA